VKSLPPPLIDKQLGLIYSVEYGCGKYKIEVKGISSGQDITVIIAGGEEYHIGATALAVPRHSLKEASVISASASVLCVTGHKDDEVARNIALRLSSELDCIVTVVAGVHIAGADCKDIKLLKNNCRIAVEQLLKILKPKKISHLVL
jgi:hypothetical protein